MKKTRQFSPGIKSTAKQFNGRAHIDALYKLAKWVDYSKKYLGINERCYACGEKSEVADHLKAHKGDEKLFFQDDNIIPLCKPCHNAITARFDRHHVQKLNDKLRWLSERRLEKDLTFRVKVVPF